MSLIKHVVMLAVYAGFCVFPLLAGADQTNPVVVTSARLGDLRRNDKVVTGIGLDTAFVTNLVGDAFTVALTNVDLKLRRIEYKVNMASNRVEDIAWSNSVVAAQSAATHDLAQALYGQVTNLDNTVTKEVSTNVYALLVQKIPALRVNYSEGMGFYVRCTDGTYNDLRDTCKSGYSPVTGRLYPSMAFDLTSLYGRTFTTNYLSSVLGSNCRWTSSLTPSVANIDSKITSVCGGSQYPYCYGREATVRELLCDLLAHDRSLWDTSGQADAYGGRVTHVNGLRYVDSEIMSCVSSAHEDAARLRMDYETGPALGITLGTQVRHVSSNGVVITVSPASFDTLAVSNAVTRFSITPKMPSAAANLGKTISCRTLLRCAGPVTVSVVKQAWDLYVGATSFDLKRGDYILAVDRVALSSSGISTYRARIEYAWTQIVPPDYTTNNVALVSMVSNYVAKSVVERQLPGDYYNVSNKAYAAQMALPYTLVTNYYHMLPPVISTNYTVAVRDATWADHATAAVRADVADAADWLEDETNTIYAAGDWVVITNVLTGASVTNRLATTKYVDAAVAGIQPGVPAGVSTSAVNAIIAEAVRTNWLITAHAAATNAEYQATSEAQKVKNWTTQNFRPSTWTPGPAAVGALPDSFVALTNKPNFRNGVTSIVTQDYIRDDLGFYYTGEDIDQSFDDTFNYIDDQVGTRLAKNGKIYLNQVTNASGTTITAADLHALPDNSTTSLTGNAHFSAAVRQLSPAMGKVSMTMVTNAQGKTISAGDLGAISRNDVYNMTNRFLQRAWVTYEDEILMTNVISEVATGRRLQSFGTDGRTAGTLYLTTDCVTLPGTPWWEDYRGGVSLIGNDEYIGLGFGRFTEGDPYPDSYTTFYGNEFIKCKGKYVVLPGGEPISGYDTFAVVSDIGKNRAESDARYGSQFAEATADLQGGVRLGRGLYPVLQQNNMSVKYYTKYRACNLKIGSTSHPCYISEYDAQNYNTSGIGAIYQSVGTYPNEYMQPFQGARVVVSGTVPVDITVYFGTTAYELEIGSATLQSENACRVVEPSIFEAFSATRGYAYGQTCLKDGKLYRCVISNYYSGKAWNASYWSEIKEEPTNGVTATDGELYANGASLTVNSRLEGLASHKQNIIQINTPAGMNEEARTFDDFIQYTGTTTASFKQGHFYRMVTYSPRVWQEVETMDAYTKTDTDSAITSGIRTVLSSRVFDFQGGTNFAQRLYTTLTNIIDILGGSVTNTPSF